MHLLAHFRIKSSTRLCRRYSNPSTGLERPWGFQEVEAPRFHDNRHMKVVRLSALLTGRLYPRENIPGTHFCQRLSRSQGHSAAGSVKPMKNSNDTIGNRTRDLPGCSAVPQQGSVAEKIQTSCSIFHPLTATVKLITAVNHLTWSGAIFITHFNIKKNKHFVHRTCLWF